MIRKAIVYNGDYSSSLLSYSATEIFLTDISYSERLSLLSFTTVEKEMRGIADLHLKKIADNRSQPLHTKFSLVLYRPSWSIDSSPDGRLLGLSFEIGVSFLQQGAFRSHPRFRGGPSPLFSLCRVYKAARMISQGKISWDTLPWLGTELRSNRGQTVRFIYYST